MDKAAYNREYNRKLRAEYLRLKNGGEGEPILIYKGRKYKDVIEAYEARLANIRCHNEVRKQLVNKSKAIGLDRLIIG